MPAAQIALTAREHEVLGCIAEGKTNVETALMLNCSRRTIAKHLQRIFAKLEVANRAQAVAWWRRHQVREK